MRGETVTYTLDLSAFQWPHPVRLELVNPGAVPGGIAGSPEPAWLAPGCGPEQLVQILELLAGIRHTAAGEAPQKVVQAF